MSSANMEFSSAVEPSTANASTFRTEPPPQDLPMEIDPEENGAEQAMMEAEEPSEQDAEGKNNQAYQELLVQKAALEAELQEIINELQPLKRQLEALDKSIAEDEAELPILEAAMMAEVREFLDMSPKFTKVRHGS